MSTDLTNPAAVSPPETPRTASPQMQKLWAQALRVAPTNLSILITGESGTGKELVARTIHGHSKRSKQSLVVVDCTSIPSGLMESELFGHEKGAFTGATTARRGLVAAANNGTFFLDEVGELPLDVQVKLLRLLQAREYRPVGHSKTQHADIRVIAATNRDLNAMVRNGSFRSDLYHRLNVVNLHLLPLRERKEDIHRILTERMLRYANEQNRPPLAMAPQLVAHLCQLDWPGNIRELINCAQYMVQLAPGPTATVQDLPKALQNPTGTPLSVPESGPTTQWLEMPYKQAKRLWMDKFEDDYFAALLKKHHGNISAAARSAQVSRKSIHRFLNRQNSNGETEPHTEPSDRTHQE